MKRSFRIPVTLIFLVAVAISLTCRTAVRRCLTKQTPPPILLPRWNSTLTRFAADYPGEADWNAEISSLLRGDFPERSLSIWRRLSSSSRGKSAGNSPRRSPVEYKDLFPAFHRSLLLWSRHRRQLDPFTMSSLPENLFRLPPGRRYPSCAVVGNSGVLLNQTHGPLIDSHDLVIRLNNARIAGFSAHVGAKTNLSFVNSNILHICHLRRSCACSPYGEQTPFVAYICQPLHFLDLAACNATAGTSKILVTDAAFDLLCARIVKYYSARRLGVERWGKTFDGKDFHYSSGMQAVMAAVGACDRVGVFGFGKKEGARHHYHTNQKEELWLHDYQAEYELYRDLARRPEEVPFLEEQRGFKVPPVVVYW